MKKQSNIEQFGHVSIDKDAMATLFRERRDALGLSIRELASRAGVGATTVHSLEQGNSGVNLETFLRILAALDLLPQHVLKIDNEALPPPPATELEKRMAELLQNRRFGELLKLLAEQLEE